MKYLLNRTSATKRSGCSTAVERTPSDQVDVGLNPFLSLPLHRRNVLYQVPRYGNTLLIFHQKMLCMADCGQPSLNGTEMAIKVRLRSQRSPHNKAKSAMTLVPRTRNQLGTTLRKKNTDFKICRQEKDAADGVFKSRLK